MILATDVKGIFVCGTSHGPKDITESIMQATAASSKVSEFTHTGIDVEPFIAEVNKEKCNVCGDCIDFCKYKAMTLDKDEILIDPMICSGCGNCMTVCKQQAITINGNIDDKITATIDGMLKDKKEDECRILVFLDQIGYTAADNIGVNRIKYPESIHIIKVHSINRVRSGHIQYALANGADGVFIGEYPGDLMYEEIENKIERLKNRLEKQGVNRDRIAFSKVYIPYFTGLANKLIEFDKQIENIEEGK